MHAHDLITLAESLSRHRNWSMSTVAVYAANDGKFLKRLGDGGGCTVKTMNAVMRWFSDHWPADLEWPADIPRPLQSTKPEAA